jgi:hypothetical protein
MVACWEFPIWHVGSGTPGRRQQWGSRAAAPMGLQGYDDGNSGTPGLMREMDYVRAVERGGDCGIGKGNIFLDKGH